MIASLPTGIVAVSPAPIVTSLPSIMILSTSSGHSESIVLPYGDTSNQVNASVGAGKTPHLKSSKPEFNKYWLGWVGVLNKSVPSIINWESGSNVIEASFIVIVVPKAIVNDAPELIVIGSVIIWSVE